MTVEIASVSRKKAGPKRAKAKTAARPPAALEPDNAAYLQKCEEKLGFVPNVLKAYAFDNAKLRAFILMSDDLMLGDSGLTKAEREMIAVAVSAVNHCHYCLTSHGAALRLRSGNPELSETIAQNYRAAGLEPRHEAMLDYHHMARLQPSQQPSGQTNAQRPVAARAAPRSSAPGGTSGRGRTRRGG